MFLSCFLLDFMWLLDVVGLVGVVKFVFRGGGVCFDFVFGVDMDGWLGVLIGGFEWDVVLEGVFEIWFRWFGWILDGLVGGLGGGEGVLGVCWLLICCILFGWIFVVGVVGIVGELVFLNWLLCCCCCCWFVVGLVGIWCLGDVGWIDLGIEGLVLGCIDILLVGFILFVFLLFLFLGLDGGVLVGMLIIDWMGWSWL